MDFSDNARALFEYMLSIGLNGKYQLVWFVRSPEEFLSYTKYQNVLFLPFSASDSEDASVRECYYRILCLAKFFFFTDAYGFVRNCRSDQIRVQLWHGCGYKRRLNGISCEKRYEFMTVTSPLYARLHAREFGLRENQMLVTGCAKTDWLFEAKYEMLDCLGIPKAHKYIFWLPTYRFSERKMNKPVDGALKAGTGLPLISDREELKQINKKLRENDIVLVIKAHPFQDVTAIHVKGCSNIVLLEQKALLEKDIQINQVLGKADALISDYSSVAVDYLILDRPMAFCVEDAGSYADSRGFIFDDILEWLPGKLIFDMPDLLDFIGATGRGLDEGGEKRSVLLNKMHKYHDGNSCRRILEMLGIV